MISPDLLDAIRKALGAEGKPQVQEVNGGSINQTYRLQWGKERFFCKTNSATKFPHLLKLEASGLGALGRSGVVRVPGVICHFEKEDRQVLLLEWIDAGKKDPAFWKSLGVALASLHNMHATTHGWPEDNYMGAAPQQNNRTESWNDFFTSMRLHPLVHRCRDAGILTAEEVRLFDALYKRLPGVFDEDRPSLLHGDLWSGNYLCDDNGTPVLIDPAVYYGHPAMDLAMTTLFGPFDALFYEAYREQRPFPANYKEQWRVANLYPLLVHLYLFGRSYWSSIQITLAPFQ